MTQGNDVGEFGAVVGLAVRTAGGHRRSPRPAAVWAHDHGRLRAQPVRRRQGQGRFGLDGKLPDRLSELPAFSGDQLDPALSGGDLAIQACANDPQVAVHAVRNLVRIALRARVGALLADGLRAYVVDVVRSGHAAQHAGLQGRHRQHQGRGQEGRRGLRLGAPRRTAPTGSSAAPTWSPQDQHAHRDLGPRAARGPGEHHRPRQGLRRAAVGRRRVRQARLHPEERPGRSRSST